MFKLSVFWPSDSESGINELRFSDSVSLSFKTRLTSVTFFVVTLRKVNFKHGTRDRKNDDLTSRIVTLWQTFPHFLGLNTKTGYKIRICLKKASNKHIIIIVT